MSETIPQLQAQMDLYLTAPTTHETARSLEKLSETWVSHHREKKAILCLEKAVEIYETLPELELDTARAALKAGHLHRKLGHNKETGRYYTQALDMYKRIYTYPHIELAGMCYVLGSFMEQLLKLSAATTYYEEALSTIEQAEGVMHPQCSLIKERLLHVADHRRKYKK